MEPTYFNHKHTGTDSHRISGRDLVNAPQGSLTTATSPSTLSTGGVGNLSTADATILQNALTRLAEIETRLKNLGLTL